MPPARLFISHSARKDPMALALIVRLKQELQSQELEVHVDKDCLESGEDWNDRLIEWMLECHGAVLLLSEKALCSAWVEQEATILNLRKREDVDFELVPVFLPGVDDIVLADGEKSRLSALDLQRLQALRAGEAVEDEKLLAVLRARCEALAKRWGADDPGSRLLKNVAGALESGHVFGLERLAHETDAQIKQWLWNFKRSSLTLALARRMAELGLDRVVRVLEHVKPFYPLSQVKTVVECLAPLRVRAEAAGRFAEVINRRTPALGVSLNAREADTGKLYARRATGEDLGTRFIDLTNCDEGHGAQLLEQELIAAVVEFAKAETVAEAQEELKAVEAPHFILLPGRRPSGVLLQKIAELFPTVSFCCLTGPLSPPPEDPLLETLRPPLEPQEEDDLLKPYRRSRKRLAAIWQDT